MLCLQKPANLNCDSIHPTDPYEYSINLGIYKSTSTTTLIFAVAAGQTFTIRVKSRNSAGKTSQPAKVQVNTPKSG